VPLEPTFFDLVVIDEASQCDIPSALPLLFRAISVVIIGDPKQSRHISAIPPRRDREPLHKHDLAEASPSVSPVESKAATSGRIKSSHPEAGFS